MGRRSQSIGTEGCGDSEVKTCGTSYRSRCTSLPPSHLGRDTHMCRQTSMVLGPDGSVAGSRLVDTANLKEVTGGELQEGLRGQGRGHRARQRQP